MDHELHELEESLKLAGPATQAAPPARFLHAVRKRRHRVVRNRLLSAVAIVAVVVSGALVLPHAVRPADAPSVHNVVYASPPALRKLRELPPESTAGFATPEVTRVLDARNPEVVAGLGGL